MLHLHILYVIVADKAVFRKDFKFVVGQPVGGEKARNVGLVRFELQSPVAEISSEDSQVIW